MQYCIITALVNVSGFGGDILFLRTYDIGHGVTADAVQAVHCLTYGILISVDKDNHISDPRRFLLFIVKTVVTVYEETGLEKHGAQHDDEEKYSEHGPVFSDIGSDQFKHF